MVGGFKLKTINRLDARGVLNSIIVVIHVEILWESTTCVGRDSPLRWFPKVEACQGSEISQLRRDGTCSEPLRSKLERER